MKTGISPAVLAFNGESILSVAFMNAEIINWLVKCWQLLVRLCHEIMYSHWESMVIK